MILNKTVTGIILVAGNSTRYNRNVNKNFEILHGKSILSYSINIFNKNKYIDEIMIVIRRKDKKIIDEIVKKEKVSKNINIVIGGSSRQESVYNAIKTAKSDIVIIHDGARPALKQKFINELIESMDKYRGATIGIRAKDTIKLADDDGIVFETTNRTNTWLIQTPQCFDRKVLLKLHKKYIDYEVTDDCMYLEKGGYKVKIIEGEYTNIKITTLEDMSIMKEFMKCDA